MTLEHQVSVNREGMWFAFLQKSYRLGENSNISGLKVAVKTMLKDTFDYCLQMQKLVFLYLYIVININTFSDVGKNTLKY